MRTSTRSAGSLGDNRGGALSSWTYNRRVEVAARPEGLCSTIPIATFLKSMTANAPVSGMPWSEHRLLSQEDGEVEEGLRAQVLCPSALRAPRANHARSSRTKGGRMRLLVSLFAHRRPRRWQRRRRPCRPAAVPSRGTPYPPNRCCRSTAFGARESRTCPRRPLLRGSGPFSPAPKGGAS